GELQEGLIHVSPPWARAGTRRQVPIPIYGKSLPSDSHCIIFAWAPDCPADAFEQATRNVHSQASGKTAHLTSGDASGRTWQPACKQGIGVVSGIWFQVWFWLFLFRWAGG